MDKRASGVLFHISSLPSNYGIGDLGPHAYAFVDFLRSAGQRYWQILPINPTDGINNHSPYSCFSAFAGNPLFISPDLMVIDGFLAAKDVLMRPGADNQKVDYATVIALKEKFFNMAYARFVKCNENQAYHDFVKSHAFWLDDFALFMVLKTSFKGACWNEWPKALRDRQPAALKRFAKANHAAIERIKFIQFLFFTQWASLRKYTQAHGIGIIGDIPIYVNYDSVEVWCHPKLFKLDAQNRLKFISGCPPDYFSKTGQRWGNPVYDWAQLKRGNYHWWVKRIEHNLELFDVLRIDHFRGFLSYWQIPAHEKFAIFGRWVKGPGDAFFKVLARKIKPLPIIAEDLGEITPDVPALMKRFGFPGMRVLLFGFGGDLKTNPHVPANYTAHSVAYSGTHDNNTIQGWYAKEAKAQERSNLAKVLGKGISVRDLHWAMIKLLMKSKANLVIIPVPDLLGLREQARMNTPATKQGNWAWRLDGRKLTPRLSRQLKSVTLQGGRWGNGKIK